LLKEEKIQPNSFQSKLIEEQWTILPSKSSDMAENLMNLSEDSKKNPTYIKNLNLF